MITFDGWYRTTLDDSKVAETIDDALTVARVAALLQAANPVDGEAAAA